MLTCSEVTRLVASDEVRTASLRVRVAVRVHLAMCRHCRRYRRELKAIAAAVRRNAGALFGSEPADSDRMHRIHTAVVQEIRGQHAEE